MISKKFALKIFEAFSIERWNDMIRPFDMVEMDKSGERMVLAYIIGKFEEQNGNKHSKSQENLMQNLIEIYKEYQKVLLKRK